MTHPNTGRTAPDIVTQLRLAFFAVSLFIAVAAAAMLLELNKLNNDVRALTRASIPVFVQVTESERALKRMLILVDRVEKVETREQLAQVKQELRQSLAALQAVHANSAVPENPGKLVLGIKTALGTISQSTERFLDMKLELIREQDVRLEQAAALRDLKEQLDDSLEGLSYDAVVELEDRLSTISTPTGFRAHSLIDDIRKNLVMANSTTALALEIEALTDLSLNLDTITDAAALTAASQNLQFKLRGASTLVGRLPAGPLRAGLAKNMLKLRTLVLGADGMLAAAKRTLDLRERLAATHNEQFQPIAEISEVSETLSTQAKAGMETTRQRVQITMDAILLSVPVVTLISLLAIAAVIYLIVERQINRRMSVLTKSAMAIADGDTEYKVAISGTDELARMANALEIFKVNARALRQSNEELERFAYAAAHDLRSPLRAIQDLADWTLEDEDNAFSPEGRENMALIQQRIGRLNRLLKDLLEYGRVGRETEILCSFSLDELVDDLADLLDPQDKYNITLKTEIDQITTYEIPLRQILMNLINNAIKHHDRDGGTIEISAALRPGQLHIAVSDDGPGIEPSYHDRIFGLFQTLQPRDVTEGSGLGLAIIRKLLDRHDGEIRVLSDPSMARGATFLIELPEKSQTQTPALEAA